VEDENGDHKAKHQGWENSLGAECLPSILKALGSIPGITKHAHTWAPMHTPTTHKVRHQEGGKRCRQVQELLLRVLRVGDWDCGT
jgi:hypothetical protein